MGVEGRTSARQAEGRVCGQRFPMQTRHYTRQRKRWRLHPTSFRVSQRVHGVYVASDLMLTLSLPSCPDTKSRWFFILVNARDNFRIDYALCQLRTPERRKPDCNNCTRCQLSCTSHHMLRATHHVHERTSCDSKQASADAIASK